MREWIHNSAFVLDVLSSNGQISDRAGMTVSERKAVPGHPSGRRGTHPKPQEPRRWVLSKSTDFDGNAGIARATERLTSRGLIPSRRVHPQELPVLAQHARTARINAQMGNPLFSPSSESTAALRAPARRCIPASQASPESAGERTGASVRTNQSAKHLKQHSKSPCITSETKGCPGSRPAEAIKHAPSCSLPHGGHVIVTGFCIAFPPRVSVERAGTGIHTHTRSLSLVFTQCP